MDRESLFYTVVDTETGEEQRINIEFSTTLRFEPTVIEFPEKVSLSPQQLAELGYLLVALSRYDFDSDSVDELISGYGYDWLVR